jgi:3',5'-cyclic-AMP phosphodiesterase
MPIHLPPVSRRSFLRGMVFAGAGLVLRPPFAAAEERPGREVWAMLSDPHIAADPATLGRGINMSDHLTQACREILAMEHAPRGVIIHGDCAFSTGRRGDYVQMLKLLDPLREAGLPLHLALGNHDNLERFVEAVAPQASVVPAKYVSLVQSLQVNFFILDSLNGYPPSNPGLLGEAQLQWLGKALDEHADKPAIIVVHHNPPKMDDYPRLLELMDARHHVKAMFYGHRHIWGLDRTPGGVHLINLLPVAYPSPRAPEPGASGWVQATFTPDGVRLDVRCINPDNPLHGTTHDLRWRAT